MYTTVRHIFVQREKNEDPGPSRSEPGIIRDDWDASGMVSNLSTLI